MVSLFLLFMVPAITFGSVVSPEKCRDGTGQCSNGTCSDACGINTSRAALCVLPPFPLYGTYTVVGDNSRPGDTVSKVVLDYSCDTYYKLTIDKSFIFCNKGTWFGDFPECLPPCQLQQHESVTYQCSTTGSSGEEETRNCNLYEPFGTIVRVDCKPNYFSRFPLPLMRCQEGGWDTYPICTPDCGTVAPKWPDWTGDDRGQIPWLVGIYRYQPGLLTNKNICAGSIVTKTHVITAAHCFLKTTGEMFPTSNIGITVGRLYSGLFPVNNDVRIQVKEIKFPAEFLKSTTDFQGDIAILILKEPIPYENVLIRPVCLDFDHEFDNKQLQAGNMGKVAGWRLDTERIYWAFVPFVSIDECVQQVPDDFRGLISSDKFCAGNVTRNVSCPIDGGGGVAFSEVVNGIERYYLRGVLSVTPRVNACADATISGFTHVLRYERFIRDSIGLDQMDLKDNLVCGKDQWRCHDGACILLEEKCNQQKNCKDGSDESSTVCHADVTQSPDKCVLPPYPKFGTYTMEDNNFAVPGQKFTTAFLNYTCVNGYGFPDGTVETIQIICQDGKWSDSFPTCVRLCRLDQHPSIEYRCRSPDLEGYRQCNPQEPLGTVVHPNCRAPLYYFSGVLSTMRCLEDGWDNNPVCLPECGRLTPGGKELIIGGRAAIRGEVPWHAGIYRSNENTYSQICGGSVVSTTVVISAAHCFWKDIQKKLPASNFAVAVGKLFRDWNHPNDTDAQKLQIKDIVIPSRFRGTATNFQDDIALVIMRTPIRYEVYVRPVCLDFDNDLERRQLSAGKIGKVAGWGLTAANGHYSSALQIANLPYIDVDDCYEQVPRHFRELVTSDKFCAGYRNGTALCQGDSGGGLAFPESDKGVQRYYLRGIVSTAPNDNNKCNQFTITTFTQVTRHIYMIKDYL